MASIPAVGQRTDRPWERDPANGRQLIRTFDSFNTRFSGFTPISAANGRRASAGAFRRFDPWPRDYPSGAGKAAEGRLWRRREVVRTPAIRDRRHYRQGGAHAGRKASLLKVIDERNVISLLAGGTGRPVTTPLQPVDLRHRAGKITACRARRDDRANGHGAAISSWPCAYRALADAPSCQ